MEKIGEKIKRIRKENGWSQDAVLPNQQSVVSQIEKGTIKNPGKAILKKIAKGLEMDFDGLIDQTDWDRNKEQKIEIDYSQNAFSLYNVSVELQQSGRIITRMKTFPRYNEDGHKNLYDPETGFRLWTRCPFDDCNRNIEQSSQQYCMSCGEKLKGIPIGVDENGVFVTQMNKNEIKYIRDFYSFEKFYPEISQFDFWHNRQSNDNELNKIAKLKKELQEYVQFYFSLAEDEYGEFSADSPRSKGEELNVKLGNCVATQDGHDSFEITGANGAGFEGESGYIEPDVFFLGTKSPSLHVRKWWSEYHKALLILEEVRWQLLQYRAQIESTSDNEDGEDNKTEVSGESNVDHME